MNTHSVKNKLKFSLFFLLLASATVSHAGLYRWVDGSGKVHFSDKIPPAAAKVGHSVLNKDGVEKKKVMSAEEINKTREQEQKKLLEEQQLALNLEKKKQERQEQRKHDIYLLSTFDSKDELVRYFETKISTLKGTANILIARNDSLAVKTKNLIKKQKVTKNKVLQNSIQAELDQLKKSMLQYDKALNENEEEIKRLKKQYQKDIKRYDELSTQNPS